MRSTLLAIILVSALLLVTAAQAEDANDWISRGESALTAQQYTDALTYFDKALALDANSASAWSGKAAVLNSRGDYPGALDAAAHALNVNANNVRAINAKAYAYLKLQQYNESVYAYNTLFKTTQVNTADAYCNQAYAYWQENRTEDAVAVYKKCTSFNPLDFMAWNNLGLVYMDRGEYDQALSAFTSGTGLTVTNATLWNNKGKALVALGRPSDARDCFGKAVKIDPGFADAKNNLNSMDGQLQVFQVTGTVTTTPTLNRLGTYYTTAPPTPHETLSTPTPLPTHPPDTTVPVPRRTTYAPLSAGPLLMALTGACAAAALARSRK